MSTRRSRLRDPRIVALIIAAAASVAVLLALVIRGSPSPSSSPPPSSHRRVVSRPSSRERRAAVSPSPGAPGPPIACTSKLQSGADVERALARAAPGAVVCLEPGRWGELTLTDIAPVGEVTLAAAPGAPVHLDGLTVAGEADAASDTRNLTVRGFWIDRGVQDLTDTSGGLTFSFDTIERVPHGYGFYFYADGNGGSHFQTGVTMRYDRIDHVGECLAVDGGTAARFSFDHNVCGPGIGYRDTASTQPGHYIQTGGIRGISIDHNVFRGPAAPGSVRAGLHLNVLHVFGGARNVEFSDNRLWHTQAIGQAILLQEGPFEDVRIDHNLDVEDPACGSRVSSCANYMIESADVHGLSFEDNTVIGAYWGVLLTVSDHSGDYPSGRDYTVTHNIVIGGRGGKDLALGGCAAACTFDDNVTDDDSAWRGGVTHAVANWHPHWTDAAGYLPAGLPFAAGYAAAGR
jgi:hypothetical protein